MEFDLIQRYFTQPFEGLRASHSTTVPLGIGDDCATLLVPNGEQLHVSADTLVAGVHFFDNDNPEDIGWKALASNLSDLAACGARPLGFTLCISLPLVDHTWLAGFSAGLLKAAQQFNCPLLGGDTTGGGKNTQICLSINVLGTAPVGHTGFARTNARVNDRIWVSGLPGLARLGLLLAYHDRGQLDRLLEVRQQAPYEQVLARLPGFLRTSALAALNKPAPRLELGLALRGLANAALDLSDGLSGDLAHVAKASQCALEIDRTALADLWTQCWPDLLTPGFEACLSTLCDVSLTGGDDFELCWTATPESDIGRLSVFSDLRVTSIGRVKPGQGVWLHNEGGERMPLSSQSYVHFSQPQP